MSSAEGPLGPGLRPEHQRLDSNGTYTAWAEQLRESDQQVDSEDEQFAHAANGTMTAVPRKIAPRRWISSYYEFASHRLT